MIISQLYKVSFFSKYCHSKEEPKGFQVSTVLLRQHDQDELVLADAGRVLGKDRRWILIRMLELGSMGLSDHVMNTLALTRCLRVISCNS